MPGTRRRKILIKKLGLVKKMVVIFPHSGFKKMINIKPPAEISQKFSTVHDKKFGNFLIFELIFN